MESAILTASLIVQLYSGEVHVTDGMTTEACRQAVCQTRYHQSCEAQDAAQKRLAEIQARERAELDARYPRDGCAPNAMVCIMGTYATMGTSPVIASLPSDIHQARCVP